MVGDGDWEWVYAGLRFDLGGGQPPEVAAAALAALQGLPPHRLAEALLPLPGQDAEGVCPLPLGSAEASHPLFEAKVAAKQICGSRAWSCLF